MSKIHLVTKQGSRLVNARIIGRLVILMLAPAALLYGSAQVVELSALTDSTARSLLVPTALFATNLAALFLPTSIIVGRGVQGFHDRACGTAVSVDHSFPELTLTLSQHLARTFIATTVASVLLTGIEVRAMLAMNFSPYSVADKIAKDPLLKELDLVFGARPDACIDAVDNNFAEKRLWVNLRCNGKEGESTINFGVRRGPFEGKVLAYGFAFERPILPMLLVSLDREKQAIMPRDSKLITVYVFLDSIAFHSFEIRGQMAEYLSSKLLQGELGNRFNAAVIKFVRFNSVGLISFGLEDTFILSENRIWRDSVGIEIPSILRVHNIYPPPKSYVTEVELD